MKVEQFVMAYGAEQDRLRAILPDGFVSLRPVLRINAEIRNDTEGYVEFNTAVEKDGLKGWLNIGHWEHVPFTKQGKTTTFHPEFLQLSFTGVGIEGSCPAEKDNAGCYFLGEYPELHPSESIDSNKEFCDCSFAWKFSDTDAHGVSIGKTLPAVPSEAKTVYPKQDFTVQNAAAIPCEQVLGTYTVIFERETKLTEKQKMLQQMLYDANYDPTLLQERMQAKDLCHIYNTQILPSDTAAQQELIKKLLGKTTGDFCIVAPFWCDYGYNIEIGENFFANHNTVILDCAKVRFGNNVFVAPNCGFYTAGHPIDAHRRNQGLEYAYPITIGDNVWIGAGVHVMPGVTIGSNVVIGGGSVVVKAIPDNSVAVGNPCKVIRKITEADKMTDWNRSEFL